MFDALGSSGDGQNEVAQTDENNLTRTRRSMRSLFAKDAMHSKQGVTSLRYEEQSKKKKTVSQSVMEGGGATGSRSSGTPSPLQTAIQMVSLVYKGETSIGACVVAVCVPNTSAPIATPFIAIVDREKRQQCRVHITEEMQFLQYASSPQYASLYDPSLGSHWTLMFKGRRECTEFSSAIYTTLHYMEETNIGTGPPFLEWNMRVRVEEAEHEGGEVPNMKVSRGDVATISYMAWLLRRIPNTRFFSLGKRIEEIPPEAPCEVIVGNGTLMTGIEEALIGMRSNSSRLVFVSSKKNGIQMGISNPDVSSLDTIVVHITCLEIKNRSTTAMMTRCGNKQVVSPPPPPPPPLHIVENNSNSNSGAHTAPPPHPVMNGEPFLMPLPDASAAVRCDTDTVMRAILLHILQQQQNSKAGYDSSNKDAGRWAFMERSIDRVQVQLSSLCEKIDRLAIAETIEKNNAVIEHIVKKVVGKVPTNDVEVENMPKDQESLLATIERLKDKVNGMQNDLRIEQDTHASQIKQLEEHSRLKFVETEIRHREAIERVAEEQFLEGRKVGFKEGVQSGKQETFEATGAHSDSEWKERILASEQRAVELETEMQERELKHISERRRLQEQIDALHTIIEKMERRAQDAGMASRLGMDSSSRQCKLLRRAMNATYTNVETQLLAADQKDDGVVGVDEVLRILLVAIRSETDTFTNEIKKEVALQTTGLGHNQQDTIIEGKEAAVDEVKDDDSETQSQIAAVEREVMSEKEETSSRPSYQIQSGETTTVPTEEENVQLNGLPPAPQPFLHDMSALMSERPNVFPESHETVTKENDNNNKSHDAINESDSIDRRSGVVGAGRLPKVAASNEDDSNW